MFSNTKYQQNSQSFFNFDKMITPRIIEIIFFIGFFVSLIVGFGYILEGNGGLLVGIFIMIAGPLVIRVNCELIIVIFKIHEALQEIRYR